MKKPTILVAVAMALVLNGALSQTCQDTCGLCDTSTNNDADCSDSPYGGQEVSFCDNVYCNNGNICESASITDSQYLECSGGYACYEAIIANVNKVECSGRGDCDDAEISEVDHLECLGQESCSDATISDVPTGGQIDCMATGSCQWTDITSENKFTLTCQGKIGQNYNGCSYGHVTNPGGSVFCYGGKSSYRMCDGLDITNTIGCTICGNSKACRDVTFVDSAGLTVQEVSNNENGVYVHSTCEASDVLNYFDQIHDCDAESLKGDGSCASCQDEDNNGYCDVAEAYCASLSLDPDCLYPKPCQDTTGQCTIVDETDAYCEGGGFQDVSNCDAVYCKEEKDCYRASIADSEYVQCIGEAPCSFADINYVDHLECSGNDACIYATISNVQAGGHIDCEAGSCDKTDMSSEHEFTLTCRGAIGEESLACQDSSITNPGGSVFCYGGTQENAICKDLSITNSVGCLICGNEEACSDLTFYDDSNKKVGQLSPSDENGGVYVHSTCTASDVLDFLNKFHSCGSASLSDICYKCQDKDENGYCDIVQAYCANQPDDSNCIDEFISAEWTKITA